MANERGGKKHGIHIENREHVEITGVIEVNSFDELEIACETDYGILIVRGENLHVGKLNLESGELNIDGDVDLIMYEEEGISKSKGFSVLGKLFK